MREALPGSLEITPLWRRCDLTPTPLLKRSSPAFARWKLDLRVGLPWFYRRLHFFQFWDCANPPGNPYVPPLTSFFFCAWPGNPESAASALGLRPIWATLQLCLQFFVPGLQLVVDLGGLAQILSSSWEFIDFYFAFCRIRVLLYGEKYEGKHGEDNVPGQILC